MKSVNDLLLIIEDIAPELKPSQRLFIVDLILEEQKAAWNDAAYAAYKGYQFEGGNNETD